MKIDGGLFLVFIIALALIPGACANGVTLLGGNSVSVSGSGFGQGYLVTDGLSTQGAVSFGSEDGGSYANTFPITNIAGDLAQIGLDIINSASYSGSYTLSSLDADYAQVDMNLDVSTADSINVFADAKSRDAISSSSAVLIKEGSLKGYENSAYSALGYAKTNQAANSASGDSVGFYGGLIGGNVEGLSTQFQIHTDSSITGYENSVETTPYSEMGTQIADSVTGNWYVQEGAIDYAGDGFGTYAVSYGWGSGTITNYDGNSEALTYRNTMKATLDAESISGSSSLCTLTYADFNNPTRQYTSSYVGSSDGDLNYRGVAETEIDDSNLARCESLAEFSANSPSTLSIASHAVDDVKASEQFRPTDGLFLTQVGGIADFAIENTYFDQTGGYVDATSIFRDDPKYGGIGNVNIDFSLPEQMKSAILLEPMHYVFTQQGEATDFGTTVVPTLRSKGYAILRYTDSAASLDKFSDLDKYNIALINSHMHNDKIQLSTNRYEDLSYPDTQNNNYVTGDYLVATSSYKKPPKNSMVILSGCESIKPLKKEQKSSISLVDGFKNADLILGFAPEIDTRWTADSVSKFFNQMKDGTTTAAQALAYVNTWTWPDYWTGYRSNWAWDHGCYFNEHWASPLSLSNEKMQKAAERFKL